MQSSLMTNTLWNLRVILHHQRMLPISNNLPDRIMKSSRRMLTSDTNSVHVNGNRNYDSTLTFRATASTARTQSRLNTLPFRSSILEPNLHLHLAQLQLMSNLRSLTEGKVLFRVELLFEFQQLFRCECRSPAAIGALIEEIFTVK